MQFQQILQLLLILFLVIIIFAIILIIKLMQNNIKTKKYRKNIITLLIDNLAIDDKNEPQFSKRYKNRKML